MCFWYDIMLFIVCYCLKMFVIEKRWIYNYNDKKDWFIFDIFIIEIGKRNMIWFYFYVFGFWILFWIIYLFVISKNFGFCD